MRCVLLAVDETKASRRAARFVEEFFRDMNVSVVAVNVTGGAVRWTAADPYGWAAPVPGGAYAWPWTYGPHLGTAEEAIERERDERAEAIADAQAPTGAEVDVTHGDPAEAIARAAEDHDADMIVVGSSDKGFLQRLLDPSVSEALARHATRPVLVVR